MKFLYRLGKRITGLTVPQQYVCVALEELSSPLSIALTTSSNKFFFDVTQKHVFLGYKPLIIALIFSKNDPLSGLEQCCLNFHTGSFFINHKWHTFFTDKNCVARLLLKKISAHDAGALQIVFYEGVYGEHQFITLLQQQINRLKENLKRGSPHNISLPGNLHDQVRIAYSMPRVISLITVTDSKLMNMFPTDLHGSASKHLYISSLRQGGKADDQVRKYGKVALSQIDASEYPLAYALGKNHMQDLKDKADFTCLPHTSKMFSIPLPAPAISYRELQRRDSFDIGIHRIHLYENVYEENIRDGLTLAHIHQYYAQWRINHGLITKMLLR